MKLVNPCRIKGWQYAFSALAAVAMAMVAIGDTYTLVNLGSSSEPVEFSDPANWTVNDGVAATCPGSDDTITWSGYAAYISLDGNYSVGTLTESYKQPRFYRTTGTSDPVSLTFTDSLGLWAYWRHHVYDGVTIIVANTVEMGCSRGDHGESEFNINDGGTVEVRAKRVRSRVMRYNVNNGGVLVFAPKTYEANSQDSSDHDEFNIANGGTVAFPSGIAMGGTSPNAQKINQNGGTITFGGNFTSTPSWIYNWNAGTIAVTGSVVFGSNIAVSVPGSASVTLDIASGASISIPTITYGTDVTLVKTGVGDYDFSNDIPQPSTISVHEGSLALMSAGSYNISSVVFSSGTKIKLGASGTELLAVHSSLANATFAVADGFIPDSGETVLTCSDADVLAQAQAGLNTSLAGIGVSVKISGTSLVAESHYTFSSSSVTDLNDHDGWLNGLAAPAGQPATISGASTAAVMDGTVPAYSSISVEGGASLTVAATRNLPAATFEAGTMLAVTSSPETVVMEDRSYSGYVMDTATLVGTMSPSRSLSEITNIVGIRGGGWFGERSNPYTYVNVKVRDNGATLHTQFIYNDSDYTKCAFVDFTKDAHGNIYATGTGAGYISATSEAVDFDEIEYTAATYGTSNTSGAYGVKNLTFKAPIVHGGLSTVTAVGDFVTTGLGSATVDVATDCVLDLSGVDVTTEATLVKTGSGAIVFGDELPTLLNLSAGALVLQPYVEYDMTSVTVASGVVLKVLVGGELKDAVAFVQPNGKTVYMSSGVYVGVGTWATTANWVNSESPDAATDVHVHGEGTVLTIDDANVTMPASISVEGGATLRVLADVTLPPLSIDSVSKVVFGDNETTVSAVIDASLTTTANATVSPVALPVIEVTTNATLSVSSNMKFKNVDFRLYGTITKGGTDSYSPKFGYAEDGETTYFAFTADGGVFDFHSNQYASRGSVSFLCPLSGGTVVPVGMIVLRNSRKPVNSWSDFGNWEFGRNNPTSLPFNVLVDGTAIDVAAEFYASGAAHLSLVNGACIRRNSACVGHGFDMHVQDAATIDVGDDCYITFTTGDGYFGIDSQTTVDTVTVRNGSKYTVTYNSSGSGRGTFVSGGGIIGVDKLRTPSGSTTPRAPRSDLLQGFGSVRLDGDLALLSHNSGAGNVDWDRHVTMANIPFTGAGDVTVTNGVPAYPFTVTMVNGASTATGSIKVAKTTGDAETALYFANGANWAGTVVAGNVALTNLTDAAAAASVSFGALSLPRDSAFPVRVWSDGNGDFAGDTLDVGQYENGGGRLTPVNMTGAGFNDVCSVAVGKIAKGSPLPRAARGWFAEARPIDGDDANDQLVLIYGKGLQVILR